MALRNIVDQFHDDHGLTHSCTAERANLSAFGEWTNQVDDFNTRFKNARAGILLQKARRLAVDRISLLKHHRPALIYWITSHIENATENSFPDRYRDRGRGIRNRHPALEPLCRRHRDCADPTASQMLLDFQSQLFRRRPINLKVDF